MVVLIPSTRRHTYCSMNIQPILHLNTRAVTRVPLNPVGFLHHVATICCQMCSRDQRFCHVMIAVVLLVVSWSCNPPKCRHVLWVVFGLVCLACIGFSFGSYLPDGFFESLTLPPTSQTASTSPALSRSALSRSALSSSALSPALTQALSLHKRCFYTGFYTKPTFIQTLSLHKHCFYTRFYTRPTFAQALSLHKQAFTQRPSFYDRTFLQPANGKQAGRPAECRRL